MRPFIAAILLISSYVHSAKLYHKQTKLLSNVFGLMGHDQCVGKVDNQNSTGLCYNEMECLLR